MMRELLTAYILIVNLYGLVLMYADKQKASKREWRIPERMLFSAAIIGGSAGIYAGMFLFRHKTLHKRFTLGIPAIIAVQAALLFAVRFMRL